MMSWQEGRLLTGALPFARRRFSRWRPCSCWHPRSHWCPRSCWCPCSRWRPRCRFSHPRRCRSCCPIRSRRHGRERSGVGWAARVRRVVLAVMLVVFMFGGWFRRAFVSAGRRRGRETGGGAASAPFSQRSSTAHIPQRGERLGSGGLLTSAQPRLAHRKHLQGQGRYGDGWGLTLGPGGRYWPSRRREVWYEGARPLFLSKNVRINKKWGAGTHLAAFAALFPVFARFGPSPPSTTSSPSLSLLSPFSSLSPSSSSSPCFFSPFFVVGCFTSSGFDSWRFRPFFDEGTGLRVSPLRVFEAPERVLAGIVVVDRWWIGGRWGFSVVGGRNESRRGSSEWHVKNHVTVWPI